MGAASLPATAAAALPDDRAYELVTPPDKNGYPAYFYPGSAFGVTMAADSGDSLLFYSFGTFAGGVSGLPLAYKADRSAGGWTSTPYSIRPVNPHPNLSSQTLPVNASRDLAIGYFTTTDGIDPADQNRANDAYVRTPDGRFELVSRGNGAVFTGAGGADFVGASDDGSSIVFQTGSNLVAEDAARVDSTDVYLRSGGRTSLINVNPAGNGVNSTCGSTLGGFENHDSAVSADGSRVFFMSPNPVGSRTFPPACFTPTQLYLRVDGDRTIHVSASRLPVPEATASAEYQGASADGSKVFFSSGERLTTDASPGGGLYEYDVDTDTLRPIGTNPGGVDFQGVSRVSEDGSRVYFVARRTLDGVGVDGNDNLFLAIDGQLRLVATAPAFSMIAVPLYGGNPVNRDAELSADGRTFVFYSRESFAGYTSGGFTQVYAYNEDSDEVVCVSCDDDVRPTVDHVRGPAYIATSETQRRRTMTADGSKIYFESREQLVADDRNTWRLDDLARPVNGSDVYEYDVATGTRSLISTGASLSDSYLVDVAPSGRDVFFATKESLLPQDDDRGGQDIYDARVDGGIALPPTPPAPCRGDACQGPQTPQQADQDPGSIAFTAPEEGDDPLPPAAPQMTVGTLSSAQRARLARTGRLTVKVRVNTGGKIAGAIRARVRGRWVSVAKQSRRASKAGTYSVTLKLSRSASRQLTRTGRLPVRVEVRFSKVRGTSIARFTLKKRAAR